MSTIRSGNPLFRVLRWAAGLVIVVGIIYESIDVAELLLKVQRMEQLASSASTNRFSTIVDSDKDEYRFLIIGDSGSGSENQRRVADALEAHCAADRNIDGLVLLGDVIYPKGVTSTTDEKWQTRMADYYRGDSAPCLDALPIYPVLGNHDYRGVPSSWIARGQETPEWKFPGRSWSTHFGDIISIHGIDSNMVFYGGIPPLPESGATSNWQIALGHHPMRTSSISGGRHQGGGLNGWWMERQLCGRVDAYFAGHAHHLEHRTDADCETDLFVSGAAGAGLQGVDPELSKSARYAGKFHGFMLLVATPERLQIDVIDATNQLLYQTEIDRSDNYSAAAR